MGVKVVRTNISNPLDNYVTKITEDGVINKNDKENLAKLKAEILKDKKIDETELNYIEKLELGAVLSEKSTKPLIVKLFDDLSKVATPDQKKTLVNIKNNLLNDLQDLSKLKMQTIKTSQPDSIEPEDASRVLKEVYMNIFNSDDITSYDYVRDMLKVGMQENFKIIVQIPQDMDEAKLKEQFTKDLNITPEQLNNYVKILKANKMQSIWIEDRQYFVGNKLKVPAPASGDACSNAQKFTENEGVHRLDIPEAKQFQGAVSLRKEQETAKELKKSGIEVQEAKTYMEGGNVVSGTLPNGERYSLVGRDSLIISYFHLEETGAFKSDEVSKKTADLKKQGKLTEDVINKQIQQLEAKKMLITSDDIKNKRQQLNQNLTDDQVKKIIAQEFIAKLDITKELMAKDLGIKYENLNIISQPDFHIDMHIRPVGAGQIMVNDYGASIKLLKEVLSKPGLSTDERYTLQDMIKFAREHHNKADIVTDEIVKELEKSGFKVIRTPGVFEGGNFKINFMNAVPAKNTKDEMYYITNSCPSRLQNLAKAYEKHMQDMNIKVYYVGGERVQDSLESWGGLDCRTVEVSQK